MNARQKKKLFKKKFGLYPKGPEYNGLAYHFTTKKMWGGQINITTAEDFNHRIQGRNAQIRESRRHKR